MCTFSHQWINNDRKVFAANSKQSIQFFTTSQMTEADELIEDENLIKSGFDINSVDKSGNTLLHIAAENGEFR